MEAVAMGLLRYGLCFKDKMRKVFPLGVYVLHSACGPRHEYDQTTFVASGSFFLCDQSSRIDSMLVAGLYI